MIDWIKFTERQPEKAGIYLCYDDGDAYILDWHQGNYLSPSFHDPCSDNNEANCKPDYWAEINPPGVTRRSGMTGPFNDPETIKAFQDLLAKKFPMPEKPLCKDCKWIYIRDESFNKKGGIIVRIWAVCSHPEAPRSTVNGLPYQECEWKRTYENDQSKCGPEGRWFRAKEGL